MRIRTLALVMVLFLVACGTRPSDGGDDGGGDDGPIPEPAWTIDVDMSGLDRFVPAGTTTWSVGGVATGSEGIASVDVAGAPAALESDGTFRADVAVAPGLTVVPIVAHDAKDHQRQAHRSLLSARWLPEGAANVDGAGLVLTDAILSTMGEDLAGEAADIDVAAEIMAQDVLSQDDRCVTWPVYAEQGELAVELVRDGSELWLNIQIPDLYVYFEGECQGLLSIIPIAGEMAGDIDLWTRLTAIPPSGEEVCLSSFDHTTPEVFVNGWYFDVWGVGGPLQNWIITLFSGSKSEEARAQIASEMQTRSDEMLTEKLADITVFDRTSSLDLLSRPIDMHLCLTSMERVGDQLIARVAATAQGDGSREAPGAPQLDGAAPMPAPGELLLDGNLVAQLLFSAWRDGGLARPDVQQVELSLIGLLVPELRELFPDAEYVDVSIDGELPPLVRAVSASGGDLTVDIGDLMLDLAIEGTPVFRFNVHLTLDLDLVPMDGSLVPTVIETTSEVFLIDEAIDGPDAALEDAVALKIGDAAADLLSGASLKLPELPGLGAPVDVVPDAGGRFLHISLD
jgi:hypothetical protein